MPVLKISGTGDYETLCRAIDGSGLVKENRTYSHAFRDRIDFIIDASKGAAKDRIEQLLSANGMQISSSQIVEGSVPVDIDAEDE